MAEVNPYWQNYIDGARVAAGGRKPNRPGAFLEPTVLSGVAPEMDIVQQEVFGPVLSVLSFREDAQAIEIANSTDWRAPIGWSGLIVSALWVSGPLAQCFLAQAGDIPMRCAA